MISPQRRKICAKKTSEGNPPVLRRWKPIDGVEDSHANFLPDHRDISSHQLYLSNIKVMLSTLDYVNSPFQTMMCTLKKGILK